MPGGTVSSSAATPRTPRSASSLHEPVLDGGPVLLHLALGVDLLSPEPLRDLGGGGTERHPERVAEAVRGVGGEHDRAQAAGGAAAGRRGRDARLADPALARVEDRAGRGRLALLLERHRARVEDGLRLSGSAHAGFPGLALRYARDRVDAVEERARRPSGRPRGDDAGHPPRARPDRRLRRRRRRGNRSLHRPGDDPRGGARRRRREHRQRRPRAELRPPVPGRGDGPRRRSALGSLPGRRGRRPAADRLRCSGARSTRPASRSISRAA